MRSRSLFVAGATSLLVVGCSLPGGQTSAPTASEAPSAAASAPPVTMDPNAAAKALFDGVQAMTPVAEVPITGSYLENSTFFVYAVRATDDSTQLIYGISTKTDDYAVMTELYRHPELAPYLVAGGKEYHPIVHEASSTERPAVGTESARVLAKPTPRFVAISPLPTDVTSVQVKSALISKSITVDVTRGADSLPAGSEQVPLLGRAVVQDYDKDDPSQAVVGVNGVRRVGNATVVYWSVGTPEGWPSAKVAGWFGNVGTLNRSAVDVQMVPTSFAIIDHKSMKGYMALSYRGNPAGYCQGWQRFTTTPGQASVCFTIFPPLDPATTTVDVSVLGRGLVQDVPVQDGALTPVLTKDLPPLLGVGWGEVTAQGLALATSDTIAHDTVALSNVVKEGAITTRNQQLDLDSAVLFDYNSAKLTSKGSAVVKTAAAKIAALNKPGAITVTGHTDAEGDPADNLDLSKRRAQTIAEALRAQLGAGYSFTVKGEGESKPVASNDTSAGRAQNRRVTIAFGA